VRGCVPKEEDVEELCHLQHLVSSLNEQLELEEFAVPFKNAMVMESDVLEFPLADLCC